MKEKSCFLIGHRETSEEILPALDREIERHISEYGVTEFVVGRYGGFDRLGASAVIRAKRRHPQIRLTLLLHIIRLNSQSKDRQDLTAPIIRQGWRKYPAVLRSSGRTNM